MSRTCVTVYDEDQRRSAHSGILLLAHGSKSSRALSLARQLRDALYRRDSREPVALGFLDHAAPSPRQALLDLKQYGIRRARVVPLLLLEADHWRQDVPRIVGELQQEMPGVALEVLPPIGRAEAVRAWSASQRRSALARLQQRLELRTPCDLLVIVRSGHHDLPSRLVDQLLANLPSSGSAFRRVTSAALTDTDWRSQLKHTAARPCVVQAHLLFDGTLSDRVAAEIAELSLARRVELIRALVTASNVESFAAEVIEPLVKSRSTDPTE